MEGCSVKEAESGYKALELVQKETFDAIISDIRMAHGTGIELLDSIRKDLGALPLLMLITGFADITHEEAYAKGANAIFTKPFAISDLVSAVAKGLLPLKDRFKRKSERLPLQLKVSLQVSSLADASQSHSINIGRGGMFISWKGQFPKIGDLIHFEVQIGDGKLSPFQGQGLCRWIRETDAEGLPSGFGVEFQALEETTMDHLEQVLVEHQTLSTIPRG